jgi:hypothetical protein
MTFPAELCVIQDMLAPGSQSRQSSTHARFLEQTVNTKSKGLFDVKTPREPILSPYTLVCMHVCVYVYPQGTCSSI